LRLNVGLRNPQTGGTEAAAGFQAGEIFCG
jgi:hypothetical protein